MRKNILKQDFREAILNALNEDDLIKVVHNEYDRKIGISKHLQQRTLNEMEREKLIIQLPKENTVSITIRRNRIIK